MQLAVDAASRLTASPPDKNNLPGTVSQAKGAARPIAVNSSFRGKTPDGVARKSPRCAVVSRCGEGEQRWMNGC
jgi:hypothetical protein